MTIEKKIENGNVTIKVSGRLDTTTAPELEKRLTARLREQRSLCLTWQTSNTYPLPDFV